MRDYPLEDRTIGRILADKARTVGDRPFLLFDGHRRTYAEAHALTNSYAEGFRRAGIGRGDHVALLLDNRPELLWAIWGLGKLGAVAVPLNTAAKGDLLVYLLDQSDSVLRVRRGRLPRAGRRGGDGGPRGPGGARPGAARRASRSCPPPIRRSCATSGTADPHLIMYTSGTTGPSKGVISPHSQGHAVGRQMASLIRLRARRRALHLSAGLPRQRALVHRLRRAVGRRLGRALPRLLRPALLGRDPGRPGRRCSTRSGAMANIIWQQPRVAARPRPPRAHGDDGADSRRAHRTRSPAATASRSPRSTR